MTKITWPTVEGYYLEVDANAEERTVRLRYTDPANRRVIAIVFTHDRDAKAYTTGVAMTSPRNAIHLGPHGAETRRTGRHTARQLLTYVQDQVESGWLAETVNDLTEHALEILPERLELVDDVDEAHPFDEAAHLDELIAEAELELAAHNFPEGSEDSHMTPEMLVYGRMLTALNDAEAEAASSTEACEDFDDCLLVDVCDGCTYDEDDADDFDYYDDDLDYYERIYGDEDEDDADDLDGAPVCEETLAELDEELGNAEDRLADVVQVDARSFRYYRETIRKAERITDPGQSRRLEIDATLALLHEAEYGTDLH